MRTLHLKVITGSYKSFQNKRVMGFFLLRSKQDTRIMASLRPIQFQSGRYSAGKQSYNFLSQDHSTVMISLYNHI